MVTRLISGGQTGVDRAALDAAMAAGLPVGGWCPAGRRAEDGALAERYPLQQTESPAYRVRTRLNVRDSEATLIVSPAVLVGGTAYTAACASELGRPWFHLVLPSANGTLATETDLQPVRAWLREHDVHVLNVAGPRESTVPGVYAVAFELMCRLLASVGDY